MDYVSLIGAIGGVIAAIYAAMAYYRMRADDCPTLHVRFLEPIEDGTYHLVLEIHPGKRPAQYRVISVEGGSIGPAESGWEGNLPTVKAAQNLGRSYEVNIHVPPAIARDSGPDLSIILMMKKSAVLSLSGSRSFFSEKIKTTVTESMVVNDY